MRGSGKFSDGEIRLLRELVRAKVDFMLVGLSAAALQGAPVVTQDVDLWFRDLNDPRLLRALKRVGAGILEPVAENPPMLIGDNVELFDLVTHMHGLGSFEEEKRRAIRMSLGPVKVPVLPLDRIIASKRALDRPKDRLYLDVLADTLKALVGKTPRPGRRAGRSSR